MIPFDVPAHAGNSLSLTIYDVRGRRVRILMHEEIAPGSYTIHWDGRDNHGEHVPSGVYFYRLDSKDYRSTRRMLLVR